MPIYDETPLKRGDLWTADRLFKMEDELRRLGQVRGGAGIAVRQGKGGLQITGVSPADKYVGKATANFEARSGSTVHSGSVDIYWRNPASGLETTGVSIDEAWCVSSSTMTSGNSIDNGQYCTVWQDPFGTWWVSPEECS